MRRRLLRLQISSETLREGEWKLAAMLILIIIITSSVAIYRYYYASNPDTATTTPIKHLIVIMKENHSFDNYFGTYPGADGIPAGVKLSDGHGGVVTPHWLNASSTPDLPHSTQAMLQDYNGSLNDGFAKSAESVQNGLGNFSVGYFNNHEIPNYWSLASRFVLADQYFHSIFGPTIPNRLYSIAGQSGGLLTNTIPTAGIDIPSIFDQLEAKGISWRYYSTQNANSKPLPLNLVPLKSNPNMVMRLLPITQLIPDIQAGTLPAVTYIDPSQTPGISEHPSENVTVGEAWTMQVINAIIAGPQWQQSAILLTWDESGGYYDHVAPKQVDGFGYGFRVPLLAISPFVKSGSINHDIMDHTSILKFVATNWNLSHLTPRESSANDMLGLFKFP